MTEHPHQLRALEFTEADQERLVGFSCGEAAWSRLATEWIVGSSALDALKRGNRVWLFETTDTNVVGFGCLGTSTWRWPPPDGKDRERVVLIPMLGIDQRFQGKPADAEWRYSRRIMSHLIAEATRIAREWTGAPDKKPNWLVLMVHRDNARAICAYKRCGFQVMVDPVGKPVERHHGHILMKLWIGE